MAGVEKISGRTGQPVQPGHHKHVARRQLLDHLMKLAPVGFAAAGDLPEHFSQPAALSWLIWAVTL
jgi:hypothetical protein